MKTESLIKAEQSLGFACEEIRSAHRDAIDAKNYFAELAIFPLIAESVALKLKLGALVQAAQDAKP